MKLLFFFIAKKLSIKDSLRNTNLPKTLFQVLFILMAVFNGVILGLILDSQKLHLPISVSQINDGLIYFIFFSIHIFTFLPSYVYRFNAISRIYPVHASHRLLLNMAIEFMRIPMIALVGFLLGVFFQSHRFGTTDLILSLLTMILAVLSTRIIRGMIEYTIVTPFYYIVAYVGLMTIAIISDVKDFHSSVICLLIIGGLSLMDIKMDRFERKQYKESNWKVFKYNSVIFYPFKISKTRKTILLAVLIKIILIPFFLTMSEERSWIAKLFLISPVIIFTYLYNNAWGFFQELWAQTQIRFYTLWSRVKLYLSLILLPVLLDIIITFLYLIAFNKIEFFHILIYFISIVVMTIIGFTMSLRNPLSVNEAVNLFSIKVNTSVFGIIVDYLLIMVLWLPKLNTKMWYVSIGACIATIIIFLLFLQKKFKEKKQEVFELIKNPD